MAAAGDGKSGGVPVANVGGTAMAVGLPVCVVAVVEEEAADMVY